MNHDQTKKPFIAIMHVRAVENNHISVPSHYRREDVALIVWRVFIPAAICYFNAMIARIRFCESCEALKDSHP